MIDVARCSNHKFEVNCSSGFSVLHWHSSPSPCSSPSGRGDGGLRAFVSANAVFGSKVFHRMNEIAMEFAPTSLLPWGEEQDEGVSCLRGGAYA